MDRHDKIIDAKLQLYKIELCEERISYYEREIWPLKMFLNDKKFRNIRVTVQETDRKLIGFTINPSRAITKKFIKKVLLSLQHQKRKHEKELENILNLINTHNEQI